MIILSPNSIKQTEQNKYEYAHDNWGPRFHACYAWTNLQKDKLFCISPIFVVGLSAIGQNILATFEGIFAMFSPSCISN